MGKISRMTAAAIAGVDHRTLQTWIDKGSILAEKSGDRKNSPWMVDEDSLRDFMGRKARESRLLDDVHEQQSLQALVQELRIDKESLRREVDSLREDNRKLREENRRFSEQLLSLLSQISIKPTASFAEWVRIKEASEACGTSERTIRNWVQTKRLRSKTDAQGVVLVEWKQCRRLSEDKEKLVTGHSIPDNHS